jgi:putative endonuclease
MFFTYIIQSKKDNSFYIGSTSNLNKRVNDHNDGFSPYTSKKMPWKLVYYEKYENKSDAIKRELFLKKQRNRDFYIRLIKDFKTES